MRPSTQELDQKYNMFRLNTTNCLSDTINCVFRPIYNHHQVDYKNEKEIFIVASVWYLESYSISLYKNTQHVNIALGVKF
jgi:hypothetical protein